LIIILGGNNLISIEKNQENAIKEQLSNRAFIFGSRNKIPILGICGGAQFLAKKYGSRIVRTISHVGSHSIIWNSKNIFLKKVKLPKVINSYHDYKIIKLSNNLSLHAYAKDESVEFFSNKINKIYGIMWHPERNKSINKFDIELLKKMK
jgi:gamma-glutamyl-gamma-aminobutyrate hydrolase PuuD